MSSEGELTSTSIQNIRVTVPVTLTERFENAIDLLCLGFEIQLATKAPES
jgi:hypothetical protein